MTRLANRMGSAFKHIAGGWVAWLLIGGVAGVVTFKDSWRAQGPNVTASPTADEIERAVDRAEEQANSIEAAEKLRPALPPT